jgi:hypothetical protein
MRRAGLPAQENCAESARCNTHPTFPVFRPIISRFPPKTPRPFDARLHWSASALPPTGHRPASDAGLITTPSHIISTHVQPCTQRRLNHDTAKCAYITSSPPFPKLTPTMFTWINDIIWHPSQRTTLHGRAKTPPNQCCLGNEDSSASLCQFAPLNISGRGIVTRILSPQHSSRSDTSPFASAKRPKHNKRRPATGFRLRPPLPGEWASAGCGWWRGQVARSYCKA